MVEYPCVISEGDHLRLFYCGNGYGSTGIGTALEATENSKRSGRTAAADGVDAVAEQ